MLATLSLSHPYAENLRTLRTMLYSELELWAPNRCFTLEDVHEELRRRSQENTIRIDGALTIRQKLDELCEPGILERFGGKYRMA